MFCMKIQFNSIALYKIYNCFVKFLNNTVKLVTFSQNNTNSLLIFITIGNLFFNNFFNKILKKQKS